MDISLSGAILWLLIVLVGYGIMVGAKRKLIRVFVLGIIILCFVLSYLQ